MCWFYKLTSTRLTPGSGTSVVHQQSDYNFMQIWSHLKSHTLNQPLHLQNNCSPGQGQRIFPTSLGFFQLTFKCNLTVGKILNLFSFVEIAGERKLKFLCEFNSNS